MDLAINLIVCDKLFRLMFYCLDRNFSLKGLISIYECNITYCGIMTLVRKINLNKSKVSNTLQ